MSQKLEKLKALLKELFQLDQPELDFGIYRILHARSAEVTQFLDKELLPQVKQAFAQYRTADKAELEKELVKAIEAAQALGVDPESTQKVKELRARLASEAVDTEALEAEVYDHLYSFFRRYYSEGDFLSKRVYKPGVYAIPYEGEEVKLHWANADQYYIKTSEYLRDYAFRLRPEDERNPMRVHFRLVDAAEGEHGNVKEQAGKERRFKLAPAPFAAVENGELVIRFTYEPDPAKQKDLNAEAESAILALDDPALADWIKELRMQHVRADGTASELTRLRVHLDRYTARNTFDYFIHKDLGGFLRRELDFYIKNEVMHLDDVENETAPRVEQYLSKIKVIRRIAHKIIDFLAQLEDFQKKLWLKKKFVVETSYCIRLGVIPEEFYPEIAANDAQREEWVRLCAIDEITGDLSTPAYSEPLTMEFLKAHPTLVVDTRHFDEEFTSRLLNRIEAADEQTDGLLVNSENFQALKLIGARYDGEVQLIYIDPPYNKGYDGFIYKDSYHHSTWLSMIVDRIAAGIPFLKNSGAISVSIDDDEDSSLVTIMDDLMGRENRLGHLIWNRNHSAQSGAFKIYHEYICNYARSKSNATFGLQGEGVIEAGAMKKPSRRHKLQDFTFPAGTKVEAPDGTEFKGRWGDAEFVELVSGRMVVRNGKLQHPVTLRAAWTQYSQMEKFFSGQKVFDTKGQEILEFYFTSTGKLKYRKSRNSETPSSVLNFGTASQATNALTEITGFSIDQTPKPVELVAFLANFYCEDLDYVLDYFAGSGTTGHAVVNLNRDDGGQRKFILVEQADYFDTVLLPRLKKVTFTPEWKDGKPKRLATSEEAERSPRIMKVIRLESYEDTLNNLELRRTEAQQSLLDSPQAQGADGFREQYLLRYMLDVETRGSQSLLNVSAFMDPTAYKLKVKRPGSDESREVNVDLLETFNWLIGLKVDHIAAPRAYSAAFRRDDDPDLPADAPRRLLLDGRLKEDPDGPWWFRTVTGTTPDGRRTLVIWRKRPGGEDPEGIECDNLVLDEWFRKQGYSSKDSEFDLIYVNGDNNLENLKAPDDTWKVRLIEEDFFRLMFEMEGV